MITRVIILARTKMSGQNICVGGGDLNNKKMLRLLDEKARNLTSDAPYRIGEIYEIECQPRYKLSPPHI